MSPQIHAKMWMIWVQTQFTSANYRVLTVGRAEIECSPVPPGEAAHFVLAARVDAAMPGVFLHISAIHGWSCKRFVSG